jgi:hypothetical protein
MSDLRVSILVPARNEEAILPTTLPTVLRAAAGLPVMTEVLVIAPSWSPVHASPPVRNPMLRWVPTADQGKFPALRAGAARAWGDVFIMIDADVLVHSKAFSLLLDPIATCRADVVAGRIEVLQQSRTPTQCMLERWATISMTAWNLFRQECPEFLWALPGAIYAIRRRFLPDSLLVPLVDDASIGLQAARRGAAFVYTPDAVVRTPAPATYPQWMRQKFRSRRGWAGLARSHQHEVVALERAFRPFLLTAAGGDPTCWLMRGQDRLHRLAARTSVALNPPRACAWRPVRGPGGRPSAPAGESAGDQMSGCSGVFE